MNGRSVKAGLTALTLVAALISAARAEEYASGGFRATIAPSGVVTGLSHGGDVLLERFYLFGDNQPPPDGEKLDGRMIQVTDRDTTCEFARDGEVLTVTKKGTLESLREVHREEADYTMELTFAPDKITARYEIVPRVDWRADFSAFSVLAEAPAALVGRGYQTVDANGVEANRVFAAKPVENVFTAGNQRLSVATANGIFTLAGADGCRISMDDARRWGENHFRFDVNAQDARWEAEPRLYPAGTRFIVAFEISFIKNEP